MSFTTIIVVARLADATTGLPVAGSVTFTLPTTLHDSSTREVRLAAAHRFDLDAAGVVRAALTATDDPTTTPPGVTYSVTEAIGAASRTYALAVPFDSPDGALDLATVAPAAAGEAWRVLPVLGTNATDPLVLGLSTFSDPPPAGQRLSAYGAYGDTAPAVVAGSDDPAYNYPGVAAYSGIAAALTGTAGAGAGVAGHSTGSHGVQGTGGGGGAGVAGVGTGTGPGLQGTSASGVAIRAVGWILLDAAGGAPTPDPFTALLYLDPADNVVKVRTSDGTIHALW